MKNEAILLNQLGVELYQLNRFEQACQIFEEALLIADQEKLPSRQYLDIQLNLANSLQILGQYDKAQDLYKHLIERDPSNEERYQSELDNVPLRKVANPVLDMNKKGVGYFLNSKLNAAYQMFHHALTDWPEEYKNHRIYYDVQFNLANCQSTQWKLEDAEKSYQSLMEIDINRKNRYQLGLKYVHIMQDFPKAFRLNKAGQELFNAKKYDLAEKSFQQAMDHFSSETNNNPLYYDICFNLANTFQLKGKYKEALFLYEEIVSQDSNRRLQCQAEIEKLNRRKSLGKALELNEIGFELFQKSQYLASQFCFQDALESISFSEPESHPMYFDILLNLANAFQASGQYLEAKPLYEKLLTQGKTQPHTVQFEWDLLQIRMKHGIAIDLNQAGLELFADQEYEKALGLFKKALAILSPNYSKLPFYFDVELNVANSHQQLEQFQNAIELYEKLIQEDPGRKARYQIELANLRTRFRSSRPQQRPKGSQAKPKRHNSKKKRSRK